MQQLKIAVVGSGISGLSAAWLLSKQHAVTLYESDNRLGGHANTVDVDTPEGPIAVDTGFIVYNQRNYPNLTALYQHLDVATKATEMSFAFSLRDGAYEYGGSGFAGFFGQQLNLIRRHHWRLLAEISRFFRTGHKNVVRFSGSISLGAFLAAERYSDSFVHDHIIPMGAAIWSTSMSRMLDFPARSFVEFYANHGMLQFKDRPAWQTVTGGSREYINRLVADGCFEIQKNQTIERVARHKEFVRVVDSTGVVRPFDHVVLATHADQALDLLEDADALEKRHLSSFKYQHNKAVLHRDNRWMPKRKRVWSSWNYLKKGDNIETGLCLTYWMNRLQKLRTGTDLFVTLNPSDDIHPKAIEASFDYRHPVFNAAAHETQKTLWNLQGRNRTWFCGSYFGHGFHEDGVQSGLAVAEHLGLLRRPWQVEGENSRINIRPPAAVAAAE